MDKVRLNKLIAQAGVCSRRAADSLILNKQVCVDGALVLTPGMSVNPKTAVITVSGKVLQNPENKLYIMFHKPEGCVTTVRDQFNRKSVLDYLNDIKTRIYPVGRLDYATSGLLILTNDGEFSQKVTHPKNKIKKTYHCRVKEQPPAAALKRLRQGVDIKETVNGKRTLFKTAPAKAEFIKNECVLSVTIHEGRNRQVRKMCAAVGIQITALKRVSVGGLSLGDLKPGMYRELSEKEAMLVFEEVFED